MKLLYSAFLNIAPVALLFPIATGIMKMKTQLPQLRVISIYTFGAGAMELILTWFWWRQQNNLFLLHIYTIFECAIISLFYSIIFRERLRPQVIYLITLAFTLLCIADAFVIHGLQNFNLYARAVECILIICYSLYYFYHYLLEGRARRSGNDPVFLINSAFLFYFSFSFFLFLYSQQIKQATFTRHLVWGMHAVAMWILYTTIGVALWKAGRK